MEDIEIARILNEYADLFEIPGENLFRIHGLPKCGADSRIFQLPASERA
jgi:hypothetical protein